MSKPVRLSSPRLQIVFGDRNDPSSWEAEEVQTTGRDMGMAETLFAKHKDWGTPQQRPMKFQTVLGWYAMRNTGHYTGPLEQFEEECLEVGDANADDEDDDEDDGTGFADPTQPGATTD